ncbi:MAG: hypothetical protein B7X37_04770 [Halothiobacillus sp. 14-55-98]|nr:MAG: hypothetical protein B7X37_04770 [Halothiobacillus sp. 14-55-98]
MTPPSVIHRPDSPDVHADRIQIVLCGTSHTGNLGAVARAMKNMGLHRLVLVSPKTAIDDQALATAKHAADILNTARQVDNLPDALADSVEVWATTARPRDLHLPVMSARDAAETIAASPSTGVISIVGATDHRNTRQPGLPCIEPRASRSDCRLRVAHGAWNGQKRTPTQYRQYRAGHNGTMGRIRATADRTTRPNILLSSHRKR